jgi:hypothetical protein
MKYSNYQDEPGSKVKEEGAMVVIEHYDLDSLAIRKLSNGVTV